MPPCVALRASCLARGRAAHGHALLALQHRPARFGEPQRAVGVVIGARIAERDQLAEHVAPCGVVEIGADAEDARACRGRIADTRSVSRAAQHVDQVPGAEALAGAVDARQRLARGLGGVPGLRRLQAVVAVAAGRRSPRRSSRAAARGGSRRSRTGRAARRAWRSETRLNVLAAFGLLDHAALLHDVAQAVGHPGVGRQRRRGRRGRSPGSSPRCSSAGRGARRSARRACRCPCRRRWSRPSRCRPRAGSAPGARRASRRPGRRGRAARARPARRATRRSRRPSCATGNRRCRPRRRARRG